MANTLPHDQDGFLMGEGGRPLSQAATAMLSSLSGIRSATMSTARGVEALGRQMALLRQAMESRASQPPASKPRQAAPQNAATPAGTPTRRDATPRLPTPPSQPAGTQPARQDTSSAPTPPTQPAVAQRERSSAKAAQASNQARGKDGRFSGKSDSGQGKEAADAHSTAQAKDDPSAASPLTSAANRMTDAAKAMTQEAASGADQVDPTVQAMKEVAAPVARGWQAWGEFRGNGNKDKAQEGLLKRILARMGAMKKSTDKASTDASKASAQTNKHLENLENKPTGGGESGGFFDTLTKILASIPVLGSLFAGAAAGGAGGGLLSRLFGRGKPPASGAAGAAGAAGTAAAEAGAAGRAGGIGSKLLGAGGKVLRKIPLIGGLIAALGTASEVSDIEGNDQLSRKEKDQRSGKAVGGFGGMLAGGAAGAKIGALAGAAFGPLGAAIGGALGGVVGMFLGDQAGQIIGDKMGGWVNDLRQYDIPGKLTEAWDSTVKWVKDSWSKGVEAFTAIPDKIASTWDAFVKGVSDKFGIELPKAAEVTKAVEITLEQANELARETRKGMQTAADKAVDAGKAVADKAVETGKAAADKTVQAAKDGGKWVAENTTPGRLAVGAYEAGKELFSGNKTEKTALKTGADYSSGNISGLDDAHTRALVASTAMTESQGGNLSITNKQGYVGRYQAGAGWLADAGLINGGNDAVKAAMKKDGFSSEWKWASSGGMTRFLSDNKNWVDGMSLEKYKSSAEIQDKAFRDNSSQAYTQLKKNGYINDNTSQDEIAGLLKARHIAGIGGAIAVARGGDSKADANGTTARKYYNDLYKDHRFISAYNGMSANSQTSSVAAAAPVSPRMPSPVAAVPTVSTPPAPQRPPQMASTAAVPDTKVEPAAPVAVAASGGGASGMAAQGVSQHLSNPTIAHIVTGGIGFRG